MENQEALCSFIQNRKLALTLLQQITAITEDHLGYAPDEITWEQAGTMGYLQVQLEELAEIAGLDVEEILDQE
ncbi:hypothetical protein GZ77_03960 [Endozoicomonas montiporae]|uniref:Uncharacterized protein n=2 Tax=Endozoicomonas montiporae TaxID=1027273 RepID=A0A081NB99_9GAMM|nr:hypothetical protein [Endozoicomonas montiporae]AMO56000.1 hypothetical protein EZMO1_1857 [Endozoicomonas montiporae CL-33]KEQ15722.1 hypothetical protein GZ77_03960 [Endozoicomonas montiporae]